MSVLKLIDISKNFGAIQALQEVSLMLEKGQVVGLNTFIIRESEERGVAEGIAFAIPAETAKGFLIPWIAAHTGESVPIPVSGESN